MAGALSPHSQIQESEKTGWWLRKTARWQEIVHSVSPSLSYTAWWTEKDEKKWSIQKVVERSSLIYVNVSWVVLHATTTTTILILTTLANFPVHTHNRKWWNHFRHKSLPTKLQMYSWPQHWSSPQNKIQALQLIT